MPDPQGRYSSADIPNSSNYPDTPELPEHASESHYRAYAYGDRRTALTEPARKIGWVVGTIVGTLEQIRYRAKDGINEAQSVIRQKTSETGDSVSESLDDAKLTAQHKLNQARYKAADLQRRAVQDYPLQVILGAGVAGIVVGAGLRAWKENRG
ncbi:MAG: hypothetical protein JWO13_2716 [Acidobacteriales bacterium]|nr:hypothetical protein [Terriglobales bacterium]